MIHILNALNTLKGILQSIKTLADEAEAHRAEYNLRGSRSWDLGMRDVSEYWKGRRDEAGHFRDRLIKLLERFK